MIKRLMCFLLLSFQLFAQEVEVLANKLTADQNTKITHLIGNVSIKSNNDKLLANEVFIYFGSNNRPINYHAIGNVNFELTFEDNRKITGSGKEAFYNPQNEEYKLIGNAKIKEIGKTNQVEGEEIQVNRKTGFVNVIGGSVNNSKRPARLIFTLDKNQTKIQRAN